jgi:hypothetical protein
MNTLRRSSRTLLALSLLAPLSSPASASELPEFITTKPGAFSGFSRYDPVTVPLQSVGYPPVTWTIVNGALPPGLGLSSAGVVSGAPSNPGAFSVTFKAVDSEGQSGTRTYSNSVYAVPKPKPIDIPYTLTAIYMPKPSWPSHQWGDIRMVNEKNQIKATFGQRRPLLGYYRGDSPEVLDWQIKMAVDRGITNFMFLDAWIDGFGPTYDTSRQAFFNARYRNSMTFGALFGSCGTPTDTAAARQACFLNTVVPWYVANYFNQPNYLRVGGKPVIQLLSHRQAFGTIDPPSVKAVLDAADLYIAAHTPYSGAYWITCESAPPTQAPPNVVFGPLQAAGFKAVSPYYVLPYLWPAGGWGVFPIVLDNPPDANQVWPTGLPYADAAQEAAGIHAQAFAESAATGVKFITAIAPDFDSRSIYWETHHLYFSGQTHTLYWGLLSAVRNQVDANPDALAVSSNTGKPLVGLGPWNEQLESSTVEPGHSTFQRTGGGNGDPFFMASAAAKVFGGPASYDSYAPGDYSRGFPVKNDWTFSSATGAGLDEWNSMASAGLSIGQGDVLLVDAPGGVVLNTPTFVPTSSYQRIKLLVRVDQGAERLAELLVHTRSSDYSDAAHLFETPEEPGHQFFNILMGVWAPNYTTVDGFRLYTFEVGAVPSQWRGKLKYLELRFEPCQQPHPDVPPELWCPADTPLTPVRYAIKRVWLE